MGLTRRKEGYYVEFRVVDEGQTLRMAQGIFEGKLKRWKTSTTNKTVAKQQEAKIKTDLMMGKILSDRVQSTRVTFAHWAKEYVEIEEVRRLRSYRERCQRINAILVPFFGKIRIHIF